MKVLVVEDDPSIAEPLRKGLSREGFRVEIAATAAAAAAAGPADIVLLDLGLPDDSGLEVCRRIRRASNVPIIMVTARSEEIDRVVGLELGADDYVVKPFGIRELVARMRAVLRRSSGPSPEDPIAVGALSVDVRARRALLSGREISLTPREFDLLALLARETGAAVGRRAIVENAWGMRWLGPTRAIDVHVASLRRKLSDPRWIETVRGMGFRLTEPAPPGAPR